MANLLVTCSQAGIRATLASNAPYTMANAELLASSLGIPLYLDAVMINVNYYININVNYHTKLFL